LPFFPRANESSAGFPSLPPLGPSAKIGLLAPPQGWQKVLFTTPFFFSFPSGTRVSFGVLGLGRRFLAVPYLASEQQSSFIQSMTFFSSSLATGLPSFSLASCLDPVWAIPLTLSPVKFLSPVAVHRILRYSLSGPSLFPHVFPLPLIPVPAVQYAKHSPEFQKAFLFFFFFSPSFFSAESRGPFSLDFPLSG